MCRSFGGNLRYQRRPGEPELWKAMRARLNELMEMCPRVTATQAATYRKAFDESRDDHVPAIEAMKRRAVVVLRPLLDRCVRFDTKPVSDFWLGPRCRAMR